jgi:thiamine biosynthesis lipoprotein
MSITRRRFVITAAACGLPLAAGAALPEPQVWTGPILGAVGTLKLHHPDAAAAREIIGRAVDEARRLEGIFSLYDTASEICRLNREGILVGPSAEMVELIDRAVEISKATNGTFDPTVQPLWRLLAAHFSRADADPAGPGEAAIAAALGHVGLHHLTVGRDRVVLASGAGLTLNGIAQGYVSDRVVALLRRHGVGAALVDMGEPRVFGGNAGGPWRIGIAGPAGPEAIVRTVALDDGAVATSSAAGFRFDADGRLNHIFDPHSGRCGDPGRSVTVRAGDATTADGLSTAFSLMDDAAIAAVAAGFGDIAVLAVDGGGPRLVAGRF